MARLISSSFPGIAILFSAKRRQITEQSVVALGFVEKFHLAGRAHVVTCDVGKRSAPRNAKPPASADASGFTVRGA
jgi:hypothetical protein